MSNVQADPKSPGRQVLVVGGSEGADSIRIRRNGRIISVSVVDAGDPLQYTERLPISFDRIEIDGYSGDDDIRVDSSVALPVMVLGGEGNDNLWGGSGVNTLLGGNGNDTLMGGFANDALEGGAGDDHLYGSLGNDLLVGGAGNDSLRGGAGADVCLGGAGNDWIDGGIGNDILNGDEGSDWVLGDDGDDLLALSAGTDTLRGGAGRNKTVRLGIDPLIDRLFAYDLAKLLP